jgi:DHA1 family multidrug resistance protein-like MFS transporter
MRNLLSLPSGVAKNYNAQDNQMIRKIFPILALAIFSSMLGVGIISPLLPLYAENLGATVIWVGMIFAGFSISRVIITPIIGMLSDRRGRKILLSIGLLSSSIISVGYIWANSPFQLTLVRLFHGAASGMVLPIAQAYIGDISPEGEEGKWMGYFNAAFYTGFGFGPLMGGILTDYFGTAVSFGTMGVLNLLAFLIVVFYLPEVRHRKAVGSNLPSFKELSTSNTIKGLFSFQLAFSIGRGTFATFLPIFAAIYIGLSPTLVGILLAVNILLMALLQVYCGNIADRFNRRVLVVIGGIVNLIYLALIPLGGNFWQLLGICALGGIAGAISTPALSAMTVEEGRRFGMGSAVAIVAMSLGIGMIIGPLLSGVTADLVNISSVFYFAAAIGIIGTSLFSWFTQQLVNPTRHRV